MFFAVLAGACAALAAGSAKLAFGDPSCKVFAFIGIIAYIVFNVLMWWAHLQSLRQCSSTLKVIVVNTGTNFFLTGALGALVFGETHSLQWWVGIIIIITGTMLVISEDEHEKTD